MRQMGGGKIPRDYGETGRERCLMEIKRDAKWELAKRAREPGFEM